MVPSTRTVGARIPALGLFGSYTSNPIWSPGPGIGIPFPKGTAQQREPCVLANKSPTFACACAV